MCTRKISHVSASFIVLSVAVAILALVIRPPRRAVAESSQLFTVVGGDYISPLITSPRALQRFNMQMGFRARFAGYDQLQFLFHPGANAESSVFAKVTRYSGDLLSILGGEFVVDGRNETGLRRVFLDEEFWRTHFETDSTVIGRTVKLGGEKYEVAGVIRIKDLTLGETDIWIPLGSRGPYGTMTSLRVIGELNPGEDWSAREKQFALLTRSEIIREQILELDTVRLLPIDRRVYFFASSPEDQTFPHALNLARVRGARKPASPRA